MLPPDTGRAMRAIRLLDAAERSGLDREEIRRRAGIATEQIADPDQRLPSSLVMALYRELARELEDPDLGLDIGTHGDIRQGGVLGYAMMHSSNAGRALRRLTRFSRLISTRMEFSLLEGPDVWHLASSRPSDSPGFRLPIDTSAASLVTIVRQITGRQIDPVQIEFPYRRPDDLTRLRAVFRCDLVFDEPRPGVRFRTRDMAAPLERSESKLARYLDRLAEQDLAALPRWETFTRRVGRCVWKQLSEGQPTVSDIARELGLSTRTLQRRLREEKTSFAQVVNDLRRQLAPTLLRDETLAVYEIAYLLGYADPSAFFRAFRRWNGCSPAEFRQIELRA